MLALVRVTDEGNADIVLFRERLQLSKGISLHIDAENLFDSYYLESSYSDVWITPGAPLSVKGRVSFAL